MNDEGPSGIANGFFGRTTPGNSARRDAQSRDERSRDERSRRRAPRPESPAPARPSKSSKPPERTRARTNATAPRRAGSNTRPAKRGTARSAPGQDSAAAKRPTARVRANTTANTTARRRAPEASRVGAPPARRRPRQNDGHGGGTGRTPTRPTPTRRNGYAGVGVVFCLLLTIAAGKLTDLQVISPNRYRNTGVAQRMVRVQLQAPRGAILDRNGQDLAVSVPRSTIVADPTQVSDVDAEATRLAGILKMDRARIVKLLHTKSRFVYLARVVPDATAKQIEKARSAGELDGIDVISEYERIRPNQDEARSIIGLTDVDSLGISGLEKQYEKVLAGTPGELSYEDSALGPIPGGQRDRKAASPGDDIELTLDVPLQYAAEQLVAAQVRRTGSESGIAVITRPSTGEILSMVNVEADPKTGRTRPSTNNEALTTVFEPGSVNKVITVAAALADGKITPATVFQHPSTLMLGGAEFGEAEAMPYQLSVSDILTVSSNIGTIEIAQMLGKNRVDQALREFGFGRPTGLDFPNESPGLLLPPAQWSGSSIGSIPIGQGISVTAMQMLSAYNAIANGGVTVEPQLVRAIIGADGRRHPTTTAKGKRIIPAATAAQLRGILANVVKTGTGKNAAVPGYQVAGKTGTARKPLDEHMPGNGYMDLNGRYHYVSTFVGMLPAGDPQLSIIVVLNDPSGSYYASDTAAPLFSQLAIEAARRFHIPPASGPDPTAGLPSVNPQLLDSTAGTPPTTQNTNPDSENP